MTSNPTHTAHQEQDAGAQLKPTHCVGSTTRRGARLELETRPNLTTREAALVLNRAEQTMRRWACYGSGPIQARRINGRLAWPVAELRKLTGVSAAHD